MAQPEYLIQVQVATYLRLQYPTAIWTSTLNGVRLNIGQAVKAKRSGMNRGIPDIVIFEPRGNKNGLFIELKAEGGRPRPEQKVTMERLRKRGYCADFAYSFSEAKAMIDTYMSAQERIYD